MNKDRLDKVENNEHSSFSIDFEKKYMELLYAVERVFPGETRHETALRYIQEAEKECCGGEASNGCGCNV